MSGHSASKLFLFAAWAMLAGPYAGAQRTAMAASVAAQATSAHGESGAAQSEIPIKTAAAYEVVSVKPSQPGCPGMSINGNGRSYTGRCMTLWALIYNAYKVRSFEEYPPGLPGWADKDKFDIDAKAGDDTMAAMEKLTGQERGELGREMLQSLLVDRFHLRVHYESTVQPIYELVVAKGGFKLKPLPADQKPGGMSGGPGELIVHGMPVAQFAHWMSMSNPVGRSVVDKTGIVGNYDIDLKWTPDDKQGAPDAGPTLFTAIGEQLGLKLQPAKGPVDTLVVDHAEKPSAN